MNALCIKASLHFLFAQRGLVIGHDDASKFANGILRRRLVQLLEFLDFFARQPMCGALDVRAFDLLRPFQFEAFFANLETIDYIEKGLTISFLQIH